MGHRDRMAYPTWCFRFCCTLCIRLEIFDGTSESHQCLYWLPWQRHGGGTKCPREASHNNRSSVVKLHAPFVPKWQSGLPVEMERPRLVLKCSRRGRTLPGIWRSGVYPQQALLIVKIEKDNQDLFFYNCGKALWGQKIGVHTYYGGQGNLACPVSLNVFANVASKSSPNILYCKNGIKYIEV
jgi:hypothetical protein